ncbi:hypothetical protein C4568_02765 [Candidatus Parcubacteria bacterium]|nr:MAG: hypothetical protein C4568_02765 [Candidatus Parcubacteria bacterium]
MNNLSRVSLAALIGLIALPVLTSAAEVRTGDQPSLATGTALTDDLYMAGGSVTSAGTIQGDLISAGGNVLVSGGVSEDVVVAGGTITIVAPVGDDLRAAGGTITIQSTIADDVLLGGGTITLAGEGVGGDAIIGGGQVRVDAPIRGSARIMGGDIYINAPVAGDLRVRADKLTLGPSARIEGDLIYTSPREAVLEEGAMVAGETTYEPSRDMKRAAAVGFFAFLTIAFLVKFLAVLFSALVFGYVFKRFAHELSARTLATPWSYLGWGLVFMIVLPIISIALFFTLVGIPFGIIGLLTFVASMIFGVILAPIVIGSVVHKWLWKRGEHEVSWKTILLGTVIYFILGLIPFVGGLIKLVVSLIAIGVAITLKKEELSKWR